MATISDPASAPEENQPDQVDSPDRMGPPPPPESLEDIFGSLRERAQEFGDYLAYYLLTKIDAIKFAVERRIMMASIILIGVLAAAGTIGALLGHRWAGELLTGVVLLGGVGLMYFLAMKRFARRPHPESVRQYEAMRRRQKKRRGRDVTERNAREKIP
jgi:hypothetical protein